MAHSPSTSPLALITFSYVNVVWNCTVVQHWFSFLCISFLLSIPYLHQRKLEDVPWWLIASYFGQKVKMIWTHFKRPSTIFTNQLDINQIHESWTTRYHIQCMVKPHDTIEKNVKSCLGQNKCVFLIRLPTLHFGPDPKTPVENYLNNPFLPFNVALQGSIFLQILV